MYLSLIHIYVYKRQAQVHDISAVQYEQNHRRGNQHGNINVKNTLQLVGPVRDSRFMQFRADAGKRGYVDNGRPAGRLPDGGPDIQMGESRRIRKYLRVVHSESL